MLSQIFAQTTTPATSGFHFGISAGAGPICVGEEDKNTICYTRFLVPNFKIGWRLSEKTAIFGYIPTGVYRKHGDFRAFEAIMPAVQYWLNEKYWVLGGVGINLDFPLIGTDAGGFYTGPAVCLGAGVDLWQINNKTIDMQVRYQYGSSKPDDIGARNVSGIDFLIGLSWN